ncbi:MAG: tRNA(fMet)-specific endonuclease VapC [Verrucomicrobiales bacterium]|jgi:tRNA(fMet)-specific endonuclease VapC
MLAGMGPEKVMISEMVRAELLTGARKSARSVENERLVNQFLSPLELLLFGGEAVEHYADIRSALQRSGSIIGPNDLVIAATARAVAATPVTGNLKEFERVPGLHCENW